MTEFERLLANALIGGQTDSSLFTPIAAGVGRTDLSPLLSNVGLGAVTGGIDPVALEEAMLAEIARQEQDYLAKDRQKRLEIEADVPFVPSVEYYKQILAPRIVGLNLPEDQEAALTMAVDGLLTQQVTRDEVNKLITDISAGELGYGRRGSVSPDNLDLDKFEQLKELVNQTEKFRDDFQAEEKKYTQERFRADTLLAGLGELADFDREKARRDFYDAAGVPALGYMSSPSERYTFDPAVIAQAGGKQDIEGFRTQMRDLLGDEGKISPYSFGAEQRSAAGRARELQSKYIERTIKKEEKKRQENANKIGQALQLLGASPFQAELGAMKDFALREALS